jgi:hypothetical protein
LCFDGIMYYYLDIINKYWIYTQRDDSIQDVT